MHTTSSRAPLRRLAARAASGLALALSCSLVTACSSSTEPADPSGSTTTQAGNPFTSELVGPSSAEPGETLTATLTNTGRLPDVYQVVVEPADAAVLPVRDFRLGPGESVDVTIKVRTTPFDVRLRGVGGGAPDVVAFSVS